MIKDWYRRYVLPASILSGTIIGAGVFSLPFVFVKAGWLTGLCYLVFLTAVVTLVHLMFADVVLGSEERYRFVGYVRKYLGEGAFRLAFATSIAGLLLTLTAYLVLGASFFAVLYPGIPELAGVLVFWIAGSLLVLVRARTLALFEFLAVTGILCVIALIFFLGLFHWEHFLSLPLVNAPYVFLPFAPILFSLVGRTAIPSVINYFRESRLPAALARPSIILGTVVPAIFYLAFTAGVIGLSENVSIDSVSGLSSAPKVIMLVVSALGLLSLLGTYVVLGIDISRNLMRDLRFPKSASVMAVALIPLLFYFSGFKSFFGLISIVGGVFVSLEGMMIALMWRKVTHRTFYSRVLVYILFTIFLLGAFYEIIHIAAF